MRVHRRAFLGTLAGLGALAVAGGTACQRGGGRFPEKPITMIMPLEPGTASDVNFRVLAEEAKKSFGQNVVVVNRPGANGGVALPELMQAKPDGYTISMGAVGMLTLQPLVADLPFKGPGDFLPIIQTWEAPPVLFVSSEAPWRTLQEFLDAARATPNGLRAASGQRFNIFHYQIERLGELAGVPLTMVPVGGGQQVPSVLGGTVEAGVDQPTLVIQNVQAGKLRILAVFANERLPGLDAPTAKEQGFDITQNPYEFVLAPKGLPREVQDTLHDGFKAALESPTVQEHARSRQLVVKYLNGPDTAKRLEADAEAFGALAKSRNWRAS